MREPGEFSQVQATTSVTFPTMANTYNATIGLNSRMLDLGLLQKDYIFAIIWGEMVGVGWRMGKEEEEVEGKSLYLQNHGK